MVHHPTYQGIPILNVAPLSNYISHHRYLQSQKWVRDFSRNPLPPMVPIFDDSIIWISYCGNLFSRVGDTLQRTHLLHCVFMVTGSVPKSQGYPSVQDLFSVSLQDYSFLTQNNIKVYQFFRGISSCISLFNHVLPVHLLPRWVHEGFWILLNILLFHH